MKNNKKTVKNVEIITTRRTKEITQAIESVRSIPDVRTDKINSIKDNIYDGNYQIDSYELAKKIVNESLTESLCEKKIS